MKNLSFDWMLIGCHPLSEVASAYFPGMRVDSAARRFRRQVLRFPKLRAALGEMEYTEHTTMLLPVHIAAVVCAWGMPGTARQEVERLSKLGNDTDIF